MKEINKTMSLIKDVLEELENVDKASKVYKLDRGPLSDIKKVIDLLSLEIQTNPNLINSRVIRALHDVGVIAVKEFEDTYLENVVIILLNNLSKEIPNYNDYTLLGMDFGKEYPI
jgi:hypothetical protein